MKSWTHSNFPAFQPVHVVRRMPLQVERIIASLLLQLVQLGLEDLA
jgi:hypothetical protein